MKGFVFAIMFFVLAGGARAAITAEAIVKPRAVGLALAGVTTDTIYTIVVQDDATFTTRSTAVRATGQTVRLMVSGLPSAARAYTLSVKDGQGYVRLDAAGNCFLHVTTPDVLDLLPGLGAALAAACADMTAGQRAAVFTRVRAAMINWANVKTSERQAAATAIVAQEAEAVIPTGGE